MLAAWSSSPHPFQSTTQAQYSCTFSRIDVVPALHNALARQRPAQQQLAIPYPLPLRRRQQHPAASCSLSNPPLCNLKSNGPGLSTRPLLSVNFAMLALLCLFVLAVTLVGAALPHTSVLDTFEPSMAALDRPTPASSMHALGQSQFRLACHVVLHCSWRVTFVGSRLLSSQILCMN